MTDHTLTKRSGLRTRYLTRGDGQMDTETVDDGPWKQCRRCGMSEGMIELLGAECEVRDEEEEGDGI